MIRPTSILELNALAVKNNLEFINKLCDKNTEVMHVVKGNAYGHGIEQFVDLLQGLGNQSFAVFDAYEAYRIKQIAKPGCRILIMGMLDHHEIEWAIRNGIEFYIFDQERLEATIHLAGLIGIKAKVHFELETGMHRIGLDDYQLDHVIQTVMNRRDCIEIIGLCTHFAGAENYTNHSRIENQLEVFKAKTARLIQLGLKPKELHSACSAAALRYPETKMDMIRIGILQYGFWPSEEIFSEYLQNSDVKEDPLKRVISWKSTVMSTKKVPKGVYIGYGNSYLASHDMKIASVPVGYAHGFSRSLSNLGRVLIRGERLPVIGLVNMNMMLVDVTQTTEVVAGDEVVLIGYQNEKSISVASFGDFSNQLNYELLTRLPQDLPRVVTGAEIPISDY